MARQEYNLITETFYSRKPERGIAEKNRKLLVENFQTILKNSEKILNDEEMFFSQIGCTYTGNSLAGLFMLPLGIMLELWREEVFTHICEKCKSKIHIFNTSGSLLSGTVFWTGYCFNCGEERSKKECNGKILGIPMKKTREYPNKRVYKRYALESSAWFDKLNERRRENKIVQNWIEGLPFEDLISKISA